jgi:hypothetical protein
VIQVHSNAAVAWINHDHMFVTIPMCNGVSCRCFSFARILLCPPFSYRAGAYGEQCATGCHEEYRPVISQLNGDRGDDQLAYENKQEGPRDPIAFGTSAALFGLSKKLSQRAGDQDTCTCLKETNHKSCVQLIFFERFLDIRFKIPNQS